MFFSVTNLDRISAIYKERYPTTNATVYVQVYWSHPSITTMQVMEIMLKWSFFCLYAPSSNSAMVDLTFHPLGAMKQVPVYVVDQSPAPEFQALNLLQQKEISSISIILIKNSANAMFFKPFLHSILLLLTVQTKLFTHNVDCFRVQTKYKIPNLLVHC